MELALSPRGVAGRDAALALRCRNNAKHCTPQKFLKGLSPEKMLPLTL